MLETGLSMLPASKVHPLATLNAADSPEGYYANLITTITTEMGSEERIISALRRDNEIEGLTRRDQILTALWKLRDTGTKDQRDAVRRVLAADWKEQITDQYFEAMCLALPADSLVEEKPMWGSMECWIAYDAAKCYLKAMDGRRPRPSDTSRLKIANATRDAFDKIPEPRGITPIIFSLTAPPTTRLADITDASTHVSFDLEGIGTPQTWTWIKPDTALLCWDPARTGKITSGRQLFGNVSWWLFFENGYQALDLLDDNHDGQLTGKELTGLSAWFDRNSNGISDPGEVTPLTQLGITTIATTATTTEGHCPANPTGLHLADGRTLPTYDWIATPEKNLRPPSLNAEVSEEIRGTQRRDR